MMTFKVGDLVRFFDGDLGLVVGVDKGWDPIVYWFTENAEGACYGQDLTLLSRNE
jgi:hypothetical protein